MLNHLNRSSSKRVMPKTPKQCHTHSVMIKWVLPTWSQLNLLLLRLATLISCPLGFMSMSRESFRSRNSPSLQGISRVNVNQIQVGVIPIMKNFLVKISYSKLKSWVSICPRSKHDCTMGCNGAKGHGRGVKEKITDSKSVLWFLFT